MNEDEYPSDSDLSDEDYRPDDKTDIPSEDDSHGESDCDDDTPTKGQNTKRSKSDKSAPKKKQKTEKPDENSDQENKNVDATVTNKEAEKKRADSLWADFLKDTGTKPKASQEIKKDSVEIKRSLPSSTSKTNATAEKVTVTKIFEFAGEEVKVTKEVPINSAEARLFSSPSNSGVGKSNTANVDNRKSTPLRTRGGLGGIQSVLGQLGKKEKISTLEKSKLDWDGFKKTEGIEEEIKTHNKGKDGYLERQDFLQRADLRQFEIEKNLRSSRRSNR